MLLGFAAAVSVMIEIRGRNWAHSKCTLKIKCFKSSIVTSEFKFRTQSSNELPKQGENALAILSMERDLYTYITNLLTVYR